MKSIPDQKPVWEKKHSSGEHENLRHTPSHFAPVAKQYFPIGATIVELGCGVGRESEYFARQGFHVEASDISDTAIQQNRQHFVDMDIKFSVHDMQNPLPYPDGTVDVVYSNLSLHYFDDATTRQIFRDIWRVLRPDGLLAFSCKSIHDFHHGNGEEVEQNVFVSTKGHVRHLFSLGYTRELLANHFELVLLEEVEDENDGQIDSLIRCVARKSRKNRGES